MATYASIPVAAEVQTVSVTAPATLMAGYTFDTIVDGVTMTVQVPAGGVNKGEIFQAIVVSSDATVSAVGSYELADNAPVGHWRNDLFGCCKFGPCHPIFVLACCLPQILLAQVMTRMKLNYLAEPGGAIDEWKKTYKKIWIIVVVYFVLSGITTPTLKFDENGVPIPSDPNETIISNILSIMFSIYTIYIIMKTRAYIRERYSIPEQRCIGCEDLMCAVCCSMCTVAQMAGHTADYDVLRADYCSSTGLPRSVNCSQMYSGV